MRRIGGRLAVLFPPAAISHANDLMPIFPPTQSSINPSVDDRSQRGHASGAMASDAPNRTKAEGRPQGVLDDYPQLPGLIAHCLAAEDRQALRLSSSRLRQYLQATAQGDALAIASDHVITPSSLVHVGRAARDLPACQRGPLLVRLASRLQHVPLCLRKEAYAAMLSILDDIPLDERLAPFEAMVQAYGSQSLLGSLGSMAVRTRPDPVPDSLVKYACDKLPAAAQMEAYTALARHNIWAEHHRIETLSDALRAQSAHNRAQHIVRSAMHGDAFRAFPLNWRATLWREWLAETLALPQEERTAPLAALTRIGGPEVWPELLDIAQTACPNDKATIYAGIARTLPGDWTEAIGDTLCRLTEGAADLPLAVRVPVLVAIGDGLARMANEPAWIPFLDHVEATVPAASRCAVLRAMLPCWHRGHDDVASIEMTIRLTRALPPEHQDAVMADWVHATAHHSHLALDHAFHFACRIEAPVHRHRMVSALATKRDWLLRIRADGSHMLVLRDMVAGMDGRHRWKTLGALVCSAYGNPAAPSMRVDRPADAICEQVLAALDADVAALPVVYRTRLLERAIKTVNTSGSQAWQWAYRTVASLPPPHRTKLLLALSEPWQDAYRRQHASWDAAMRLLDATAQIPYRLRGAAVAGAETMMANTRHRADLVSYLYSVFRLKRQWQTLPEADRYKMALGYW